VKNRDLRSGDERDRYSLRLLDFYLKSSDWTSVSRLASLCAQSLTDLPLSVRKDEDEPFANALREMAQHSTQLFSAPSLGRVKWFAVQKSEEGDFEWRFRDAPVDVTHEIKGLLEGRTVLLTTNCATKENQSTSFFHGGAFRI
jgi:hypothetical protein